MEAALEGQTERNNKRTSAIITAIVTALLLLLLFLPLLSFAVDDPDDISGIMINLGTPDSESFGDEIGAAPTESEEESDDSSDVAEESSEDVEEPEPIADAATNVPKDVATDDKESIAAAKKEKEEKAADAKKKAAADAKKKAATEAKKKAADEKKRKEKELADKKKELSDLLGGGDGDDSDSNGDKDGEPDKANLDGISTGIGDIGGGLSGRDVRSRATITDKSQATGKVVVKVCVDAAGKVISATKTQAGTTATNQNLIKKAVEGAKKYTFSKASATDQDKQCGTITFNFKVK
jgi:outer membrane biosynthesis protein TonB